MFCYTVSLRRDLDCLVQELTEYLIHFTIRLPLFTSSVIQRISNNGKSNSK